MILGQNNMGLFSVQFPFRGYETNVIRYKTQNMYFRLLTDEQSNGHMLR